jgi:hypothetical protein
MPNAERVDMYRSRTAHRRWVPALHPSIVYSTGLWRISRTEEGVDVVRSGAVGPLDADASMFSDPYGELADDTGVQVALREVVLLLLLYGEAPRAGLAAVSLVRPTQGQNFLTVCSDPP